jgi:hypothetical protein
MTDLTPNDLSHLSDEEFNALCPQGHHAPGPATALSPAAQAVMIAGTMGNPNVINDPVYRQCIAAALRAAADQVVPEETWLGTEEPCYAYYRQRRTTRSELLAIAAELEGGNG